MNSNTSATMTYCTKCGAEEKLEWTGYFNKQTGEKVYRNVCPSDPCGHTGCEWSAFGQHPAGAGFWHRLSYDAHCLRCKRGTSFGW
jgi:hypothetical protein